MQNKKWFKVFIWIMIIAMLGSVLVSFMQIFV
ncbi:stressosome-associated protein Prli42 [Saccharibacillus kuerlensis]|nr:stressosome-associated protein Prli42 [Saccharibacillus kuerlensis]